ncbi:hypothetical protein F4820DRAFT_137431 [Hypoxylon rubiginosum]|uniref:Uncharacterized protein n=1 Tax=Hypoxylon rubiginosum TaxID=110542 RepID=A0ACB9Z9R7_9PEZI|nr:hypothetical protein F4820DRAFT_137431 [Hypoxylon rubiginosum]
MPSNQQYLAIHDAVAMYHLLDLPNELLHEVLSFLQPSPPDTIRGSPFFRGVLDLEQRSKVALELARSLLSVALTCHRLCDIAIKKLHHYVPLYNDGERSRKLLSVLETRGHLFSRVRFVDVKATAPGLGSIDARCLFWLPNIHTLCIRNFHMLNSWDPLSHQHVRSSPVQVLNLTGCEVSAELLAEVFSWPKTLKELWYDDWTRTDKDWVAGPARQSPEPLDVTCNNLVQAMSS